ncbi:threonine ammonia-lyase [Camelliibacillus cellulosilyticus]|uniref:L-threonine dehydratase catabolic TdcB n=1 Tax=Camelliibacillus cellulosilyticus TaxID=2174486 RepID=A0ABV9GJI1_9BACL
MEQLLPIVHRTPLKRSKTIDDMTGQAVFLKMENTQKTGSFKIRGATHKIFSLADHDMKKGVIAASAGNHAQGVALAAAKRGISAKIFMPLLAPLTKVRATEAYGAKVVLTGETYQEAYEAALTESGTFVHAFDDPDVIAGQGTVAFEMLQQCPDLDAILVPVGGGGLLAGTAIAVKSSQPSIKVIGVQAEGAAATYNRFKTQGQWRLTSVKSIADGILVKETGQLTYPIIEQYVDDMLTVSDQDIARAILLMLEREKTFVEGAGAAALAALLYKPLKNLGKKIGVMITGGNADPKNIPQYIDLAFNTQMKSGII